ncbi:MAG: hypothetical protein GEU88_17925 [Solirubrobacterales bacterium]|nr:hypothetical protein [Solirubrobacterales bacterium]
MNADTLVQISQVRGDAPINDQHTPILLFLWKLGWPLGVRPGVLLLIQAAVFLIGSYLVLRVALRPLGASIAAALVALSPPVLGQLGLLGRDTWFVCLLVLTFGLIALAARRPGRPATWPLVLAAVAAFLCLAARQNAAPAVAIAVIAVAFLLWGPRLDGRRRLVRLGAPIVAGLALTIVVLGAQVAAVRVAGTFTVHPTQGVYIYDLAAFSRREDRSLFPDSVYAGGVGAIESTSSLDNIIPMVAGPNAIFHTPLSGEQTADLGDAWLDYVFDHPFDWLDVHWDAWLRQIGLTAGELVVYHPGIDPNPFGYEIAFTDSNRTLVDYLKLFVSDGSLDSGLFIYRPFIYLLLAAAAAWWLLRRGREAAIVGALALAGLAYQVGFFLATVATQYRFEFPAVVLGMLATVAAVALAIRARVERHRASAAAPG